MFIAKTAFPIAFKSPVHEALFSQAANSPLTIFSCPPGYVAKDGLVDALTRQGCSIMWLRLGQEDRDPATVLLSLIESARCLQPNAGDRTLEQMRCNPGPIFGWPYLFAHLTNELADCLPAYTAIVLDRIDRLNMMPPLVELLCQSFLNKFSRCKPLILIAHEPLPSACLPNSGITRLTKEFRLKPSISLRLAEDSHSGLTVECVNRLVDLVDGRLVTLLEILKACDRLGPGLIGQFVSAAKNTDQLMFQIAKACMMNTDLAGLHALGLALRLEYWHPALSQAVIGEEIIPQGPWVQFLTQGWSRIGCHWYPSLFDVVQLSPGELQAGIQRAAEFLANHGAVEKAVELNLAIHDYQVAAKVLASSVEAMVDLGQWETISEWISQIPPAVLADWPSIIYVQGEIATSRGQINQARQCFTRSANLFRRRNDQAGACRSLLAESTLAEWDGDRERAMMYAHTASQIATGSGLSWFQGLANWQLGCLTFTIGNLEYASAYFSLAAQVVEPNLSEMFLQAYQLTQRQRDLIRQAEYFQQTCAALEQSERATADKLSKLIGSPPKNLPSILSDRGWLQMPLFLKLSPMSYIIPREDRYSRRGLLNFLKTLHFSKRSADPNLSMISSVNPAYDSINQAEHLFNFVEDAQLDTEGDKEVPPTSMVESKVPAIPFLPEDENGIPTMVIYCFGPFRVFQNNRFIPGWPSKKAQLVFKYLLAQRHKRASKEILMETFWPEVEPEAARRSLHQAIYSLRRTLGIINSQYQYVLFENDAYLLDPEMKIWIDCEEFEHRCRSGDLLLESGDLINAMKEYEIAESLYQDHYLSDDLYEEWVEPYRQYLWQMYLRISLNLARSHLERKEYSQAVGFSQRILDRDLAQEEAHQIIIRSYLYENQRHLAIRQYHLCVQVFKNEFNLLPSPETRVLVQNLVSD